jgi:hypothetical protein
MELRIIRDLVVEVLTTCRADETGVTGDLIEPALRVAAEIGMTEEEIRELAERE